MPRRPATPPIVVEPSDLSDGPIIQGLPEEEPDAVADPGQRSEHGGARRVENLHRLFGEAPGRYGTGVYAPPQADPPSDVPYPAGGVSSQRARLRLDGPSDLLSPTTLEIPTDEVAGGEVADGGEYDPTLVSSRRIEILPEPRRPGYLHEISEPMAMAEAEEAAVASEAGPAGPAGDLGEGRATWGEARQAGRRAGQAAMQEVARRAVREGRARGGAGVGQRPSGRPQGRAMSRTMVEEIEEGMTIGEEDAPASDAPGADLASRAGRYDESGHPWLRQPRHSGIPDWAPLSAIALWVVVSTVALADRLL